MTGRVYLDWNASAPLRPEALLTDAELNCEGALSSAALTCMVETEPALVDNLGIDLTSDLNRDILNDADELAADVDDVPFEAVDSTLGERVETIVERVIEEKLEKILSLK